jgi:peptidoglycan/LPS O-acetylase OafA/YrhL
MTETTALQQAHSKRHRRADIQGLRMIAVISVVIFHAGGPLPGGFTGVDVFFVISGYVITEMLLRQWNQSGTIKLGEFFFRRIKRLLPALAVVVMFATLISVFLVPAWSDEQRVTETAIGAMLFVANFVIAVVSGDYFFSAAQVNPLLHTWSLSVEEQFYFLFPLMLLVALVIGRSRSHPLRPAIAVVSAVGAVSFALTLLRDTLVFPGSEIVLGFYSPVTRAWEFAAGALLALTITQWAGAAKKLSGLLGLAGLALLVAGFFLIDSSTVFPGLWTLAPVVGTVLLLAAGVRDTTVVSRVLSTKPSVLVGDWSYSLYLWHWPLIVFANQVWENNPWVGPIAALVSFGPSVASYYLLENPLRYREISSLRGAVVFAVIAIGAPIAVVLAISVGQQRVVTSYLESTFGQPVEKSFAIDTECLSRSGFSDEWSQKCRFNSGASGPPIYLIGDSVAAHFDEGLLIAAENLDRELMVWTGKSCLPVIDMKLVNPDGSTQRRHCSDFRDVIFRQLETSPPGTVVLSFIDESSQGDITYYQGGDKIAQTPDEKQAMVDEFLGNTVATLRGWGHDVVLINSVPNFLKTGQLYDPLSCDIGDLVRDECAPRVPRENIERFAAYQKAAFEAAATREGATLIDFTDRFCDATTCSPATNRVLRYRDGLHITAEESRRMAPVFVEILKK